MRTFRRLFCRKQQQTIPGRAPENYHVLILGSGESGKTTIVKQLSYIYGSHLSKEERLHFIQYIHENLIYGMQTLLQHCTPLDPRLQSDVDIINSKSRNDQLLPSDADNLMRLWRNEKIQNCWNTKGSHLQLPDGLRFLFSRCHLVTQRDYVPTHDDILHVRKRTTGIIEASFIIDQLQLRVIDVGGQKSERRKWIHSFDNVSVVLYIASLSCFDQLMFEDEQTNRLVDSIELFGEIINTDTFINKDIVLFLNKKDVFKEKLKQTDLKETWPEFQGRSFNYTDGLKFITDKFTTQNKNLKRKIFVHVTNATSPTDVQESFNDIIDMLKQEVVPLTVNL